MWEIWKPPSGASQHLDKLGAAERGENKVMVKRKMVCMLGIKGK